MRPIGDNAVTNEARNNINNFVCCPRTNAYTFEHKHNSFFYVCLVTVDEIEKSKTRLVKNFMIVSKALWRLIYRKVIAKVYQKEKEQWKKVYVHK